MHFALLIGYGAGAINPYLAFEALSEMVSRITPLEITVEKAYKHYIKSINKALLKVIAKMGISTIQSYRGAQIFEAIGLNAELVDRYFTGTPSRIQGVGLRHLAEEALALHRRGFPDERVHNPLLDVGGQYQWRREGSFISLTPKP